MVKLLGFFLIFNIAHAEPAHDCMARHIQDAIASNSARQDAYAALDWRARIVSMALIASEQITLYKTAPAFDQAARPYQDKGIPILCEEFVPIGTPPFAGRLTAGPDLNSYQAVPVQEIQERVKPALEGKSFSGLVTALDSVLADLDREPRFNCMTRHILESVRWAAVLAPGHEAQALALNLTSTAPLSWDFIRVQLESLSLLAPLDQYAAQVQAAGIPILCQDVPAIPAR